MEGQQIEKTTHKCLKTWLEGCKGEMVCLSSAYAVQVGDKLQAVLYYPIELTFSFARFDGTD